jgi:hypothetical protein
MYFTNRSHNQVPLATLLVIGILSAAANIFFNRQMFFDHKTFAQLEDLYARSQYVLGDAKQVILGDGDVYTYAGARYVQGESVTSINFEHPPLAKYLYGLSYSIAGIQNWMLVPMIVLTPLLMWLLSSQLFANRWFRWLSIALLLTHTAYISNSTQTMLDFPAMFFLLVSQVVFLKLNAQPSLRWGALFGLTIGLTWLMKYPFPLVIILHATNLFWLGYKKINLKIIGAAVIAAVLVYLLGYGSFFAQGNNLIDWLRFEWWRVQWYMGKTDNPSFYLLRTIFLGKYPAWWSENPHMIQVASWNIGWPIITILFSSSLVLLHRQKSEVKIYLYWSALAFLILSTKVAEDRHIVLLLPAFALGASLLLNEATRLFGLRSNKQAQSYDQ